MRLEIENQNFFFNLVNKGHKVDIFNKEISSIDFFCSRTERVNLFTLLNLWKCQSILHRLNMISCSEKQIERFIIERIV